MKVHLLDGTYELFRHYYAMPSQITHDRREVAAARGVITSGIGMIEAGVTHLGVATDHIIESFRNDMWPGYKTGAGIDPLLFAQFPLLEEGLQALGVAVWAMVELEADDALASAASLAAADERVEQVIICTPDKDLAQCVTDDGRVVQMDRRSGKIFDRAAVIEKFGVPPQSIPDYLALVGDSADGFPGLPGWGSKSAAAVLARYGSIDAIPDEALLWDVPLRGAEKLARTLRDDRERALLFRELARLRTDAALFNDVDELAWDGPTAKFDAFCRSIEASDLPQRVSRLTARTA